MNIEINFTKLIKTIEDLNYQIEEAKASAWSSYEEMGEALDSLETGDIEDEP